MKSKNFSWEAVGKGTLYGTLAGLAGLATAALYHPTQKTIPHNEPITQVTTKEKRVLIPLKEAVEIAEPIYKQTTNIQKKETNSKNINTGNFTEDNNITLLARLIYGEARGESKEIKQAIADSVVNRTRKNKWWGSSLREVILMPKQYCCFKEDDPNFKVLKDPQRYSPKRTWEECLKIASRF